MTEWRSIWLGNPPTSDHKPDLTDIAAGMEAMQAVTNDAAARLNAVAAPVSPWVWVGAWSPNWGAFPGGPAAQPGWFATVIETGTLDGVTFIAGDEIRAVVAGASTTTYEGNWLRIPKDRSVRYFPGYMVNPGDGSPLRRLLDIQLRDSVGGLPVVLPAGLCMRRFAVDDLTGGRLWLEIAYEASGLYYPALAAVPPGGTYLPVAGYEGPKWVDLYAQDTSLGVPARSVVGRALVDFGGGEIWGAYGTLYDVTVGGIAEGTLQPGPVFAANVAGEIADTDGLPEMLSGYRSATRGSTALRQGAQAALSLSATVGQYVVNEPVLSAGVLAYVRGHALQAGVLRLRRYTLAGGVYTVQQSLDLTIETPGAFEITAVELDDFRLSAGDYVGFVVLAADTFSTEAFDAQSSLSFSGDVGSDTVTEGATAASQIFSIEVGLQAVEIDDAAFADSLRNLFALTDDAQAPGRAGRLLTFSADGTEIEAGPVGTATARAGRLLKYSGDGLEVETGPTVDAVNAAVAAAAMVIAAGSSTGFSTVADLQADDILSYAPGDSQVSVGQVVLAQGHRLEVVASDAAVPYLETAGGVRLRPLPQSGVLYAEAYGWDWTGGADTTAAFQAAIDASHARGDSRFVCPIGALRVTHFRLPGDRENSDRRGRGWVLEGTGLGEGFIYAQAGYQAGDQGTMIICTRADAAPVTDKLSSQVGQRPHSNGRQVMRNLMLSVETDADVWAVEINTGGPNVLTENLYISQTGEGNGLKIGYAPVGSFEGCFILKGNGLPGGANYHTGIGLAVEPVHDQALVDVSGTTVRGFDLAYDLGNEANTSNRILSGRLDRCEVSHCRSGVRFGARAQHCRIDDGFMEWVGDVAANSAGTYGVKDFGLNNAVTFTEIQGGVEVNPAIGIDYSDFGTRRGSVAIGNYITLKNDGDVGIHYDASTVAYATITGNTIALNIAASGCTGIRLRGNAGEHAVFNNQFDPRTVAEWTANGNNAISNEMINAPRGIMTGIVNGEYQTAFYGPAFSPHVELTEADIYDGYKLDVPQGSAVVLKKSPSWTAPVDLIQVTSNDMVAGSIVVDLICEDEALAVTGGVLLALRDGKPFLGPGVLKVRIFKSGANIFAEELSRSYDQTKTYTQTVLTDAGDPINAAGKYAGKQVFDSTNGRPVWASGSGATDPWTDHAGAAVHTPA
jgi:hypothetical protein